MRKLTVLLLSGALLAITRGASVARGGEFAAVICDAFENRFVLTVVDTSFATPTECVPFVSGCSVCGRDNWEWESEVGGCKSIGGDFAGR